MEQSRGQRKRKFTARKDGKSYITLLLCCFVIWSLCCVVLCFDLIWVGFGGWEFDGWTDGGFGVWGFEV